MPYKIVFTKTAEKNLLSLPTVWQKKILAKIEAMKENPRPNGYAKLTGRPGYKYRVADYRIIYMVEDEVLTVLILDIGNRKEVYR
jgi:mRNA interferase RelE/StbE